MISGNRYINSTCSLGTLEYSAIIGTVGQCTSSKYYDDVMMASWTASDITSLLPPTPSPTSSVTYLSGYLTTFIYEYDSSCGNIGIAETKKLGDCAPSRYGLDYERSMATSTVVTTMTYSDALCQTLRVTNYNYYAAGSCVMGRGNFNANYSISSKITTDLTVPRVTRM